MTKPCLLLNADGVPLQYFPLSVVDWKTAIRLVYTDHVIIISEYDNCYVHSPSMKMKVPSTIMLKNYHNIKHSIQLSRSNIFLRDGNTCQYCGQVFKKRELTIDHVIPRARGGANSWENLVTACSPCNLFKGCKEIEPINKPVLPTIRIMLKQYQQLGSKSWANSWKNYLIIDS